MMSAAPISVVVATYNRARLLPRALDSIARQTVLPAEILVCDDASQDDTETVVQAWSAKNSVPLHYIRLAENGGCAAARNRGLEEASGEWVGFLDSDDEYLPRGLERLAGALASHPDAAVAFGDARIVFQSGEPGYRHLARQLAPDDRLAALDKGWHRMVAPANELLTTSYIPTCSALFRRGDAEAVGWMPEARFGEDWLFWLRMTAQGDFLCTFDDIAIVHRQDDNLTGSANDLANSRQVLSALREVRSGAHIPLDEEQEKRLDRAIEEQAAAYRYFASRGGLRSYRRALADPCLPDKRSSIAAFLRDPRSLLRALFASLRRSTSESR